MIEAVFDELKRQGIVTSGRDFSEDWLGMEGSYYRAVRAKHRVASAKAIARCAANLRRHAQRLQSSSHPQVRARAVRYVELAEGCVAAIQRPNGTCWLLGYSARLPEARDRRQRRMANFYGEDRQPFKRESDLQILYRLVWFGTPADIGREANDGRGPVDFKASRGRNKTLIEMKLASNTKLETNLKKQVEVYQVSADADRGIKAIIYFTYQERLRVERILKRLGLVGNSDVVLIDARSDNKPSASKAA